jgi:hypothetical protein
MLGTPLERAYRNLAKGLERNDKNAIEQASEIEAQNTCVGKNTLGFDTLPYNHPRVELALEMDKDQYNEWDAAVAEAVDAIQNLKV